MVYLYCSNKIWLNCLNVQIWGLLNIQIDKNWVITYLNPDFMTIPKYWINQSNYNNVLFTWYKLRYHVRLKKAFLLCILSGWQNVKSFKVTKLCWKIHVAISFLWGGKLENHQRLKKTQYCKYCSNRRSIHNFKSTFSMLFLKEVSIVHGL